MSPADDHNPKPHELFAELKQKRADAGGTDSAADGAATKGAATSTFGVDGDSVVARNPDVTGRRIADMYILVPLKKGMGEDNHLYTCNAVGRDCWEALDGEADLRTIAQRVADGYNGAEPALVLRDLISFIEELSTISAVRVK